MAFHSRLNAFYLNTSYLGLTGHTLYVSVGGTRVDDTDVLAKESFTVEHSRDSHTCSFTLINTEVTEGEEVIVKDGGVNGRTIFCGHVIRTNTIMSGSDTGRVVFDQVEADSVWLLDRYDLVTAQYEDLSMAGICSQILQNFTDGGWSPGEIQSTDSVSLRFTFATVSEALRRVASSFGGILVVNCESRTVSMLTEYTDGHTITIDNTNTDFWDLEIGHERTQSRNRTIVEGDGSKLSADYSEGSSTMSLASIERFDAAGGSAIINNSVFTYGGIDDTVPGLTGVSGPTDADDGDTVYILEIATNATDQTNLATTLGGGLSGQVTHYIRDRRVGTECADLLATNDVADYGKRLPEMAYKTRSRFVHPAKKVTVSLTSPRTIADTFTIDTVRLVPSGRFSDTDALDFVYEVQASPFVIPIEFLLSQIPQGKEL